MPNMSHYPAGFANGVTVRGVPLLQTNPGKVFWVSNADVLLDDGNSVAGVDQAGGGTYQRPFRTLDFAIGQCTASRGDIIMVMPGYTQTITLATEIVMDVAGIAVIGMGVGSLRPTITFGAAAANIPVTAANMSFVNMLCVNNFADVASNFTATGTATPTDMTIEGCEFRDTSSILNALAVVTGNATANSMDGLSFVGNRVSSLGTTAATTAISILEDANRLTINDNFGSWAVVNNTPALLQSSTFDLLSLEMSGNKVHRPNTDTATGGILLEGTTTASTGMVTKNEVHCLDAAAILIMTTGSKLGFNENFVSGAADKSGFLLPAADTDA